MLFQYRFPDAVEFGGKQNTLCIHVSKQLGMSPAPELLHRGLVEGQDAAHHLPHVIYLLEVPSFFKDATDLLSCAT